MKAGAGRPIVALMLASIVVGCIPLPGAFDWMFVVNNETDHGFYLRVPLSTDRNETLHRVAHVPARAKGRSVEWFGTPNTRIVILDENCRRVGEFDVPADQTLEVAATNIAGLTGHVEPYRVTNMRDNEPIQSTDDCDGFTYA